MNKTIASDCIQGQVYADKVTKGRSSFVRVKGAHHMSFSDVPLHFEDRDAARLHCLINRCVVSFLKDHLPLNGAFSFRTFLRNHSEEIQTIDREGFVIDIEK